MIENYTDALITAEYIITQAKNTPGTNVFTQQLMILFAEQIAAECLKEHRRRMAALTRQIRQESQEIPY